MGNFFRRFLAFILGMIFGAVILSGTAIGVSYYVYKNVTLSDMGVNKDTTDLGELNDATIEEIIALVVSATNDPASYTFGDLEKNNGFSVEGFLTACGLDVSAMHPDDIESFKKVAPFTLFTENGFEKFANTVNMGVIFGLIPKTDGKYPIFSEGARAQLRSYKLSELIGADANGNLKFVEVVLELPLGSVFSSVYTETYDTATATYAYTTDEGGLLDAVGSLSVNSFMALGDADIGYQFNEGEFVDLGSTTIGELFGLEDSGDALMQTISNKTIGDLFVKEGETYTFDVMALLNDLEVGTLMGMKKCVSATDCQLEHSTHQAGWYDASGALIEDTDIAGQLMTNLYDLTVLDLTNGTFDVTGLTEGIYLGKALGLTIGNKAGYCQADCNDTTAGHKHKYYWVDNAGNYANAMNNALANISINDVMNGNLDIQGVIGDVKIGDFMGMTYCDGTSCDLIHTHQKGWYDANGNIVSGDDIAGELMLSLYDITVNNLISGTFDIAELTKGIYLGKAFGYKIGVKAGYCDVNCNDTTAGHKHNYYWVDNAGVFVGDMNNSLANVGLQDVMNGNLDIQGVLGGIKVGELMGMTYCDGTSCDLTHTHQAGWYDASGNKVNEEEIADDIMLGIYDKTVNDLINGNFDVAELTSGIYLGKALGYKIGVKAGYCDITPIL